MKSKQGLTLNGIAMTEGNVGKTSGTFNGATGVRCVVNGTVTVTWHSGTTQVLTLTAGQERYIDCKSIAVTTGTFDIGFD